MELLYRWKVCSPQVISWKAAIVLNGGRRSSVSTLPFAEFVIERSGEKIAEPEVLVVKIDVKVKVSVA